MLVHGELRRCGMQQDAVRLDSDPYVRALQLTVWITILAGIVIVIGAVVAQVVNG